MWLALITIATRGRRVMILPLPIFLLWPLIFALIVVATMVVPGPGRFALLAQRLSLFYRLHGFRVDIHTRGGEDIGFKLI